MKVISNYKTTLSASMTSSQSTVPVTSMETMDGHTIVATDFDSVAYLVIEPGSINMEIVKVTGVSGSTFTGATRGLAFYGGTETSVADNQHPHQSGSTVIMTNAHYYYDKLVDLDSNETITGLKTFAAPNYPRMDDVSTPPVNDKEMATKKYVDDTAIAGSPKATDTVYGISKLSTAAASPTVPITVGDNDTRVPTQDENNALAGTAGTPSSTNKYVTNDDTSATSSNNKVVRYGASGMLKSATTAASTAGDVVALDAANKLPAVDGSQLTNVNITKVGSTTYNLATASGTQTIAHGLGRIPKFVRIDCAILTDYIINGFTTYDGTTQSSLCIWKNANPGYTQVATFTFSNASTANDYATGVVTFDATNISIAWTKTGSASGTLNMSWMTY